MTFSLIIANINFRELCLFSEFCGHFFSLFFRTFLIFRLVPRNVSLQQLSVRLYWSVEMAVLQLRVLMNN